MKISSRGRKEAEVAPVTISLSEMTAGDTWQGIIIGPVLFNGAQPSYPLSSCRLYFRKMQDSTLSFAFESGTPSEGKGTITITNAATWSVIIPAQAHHLAPGSYKWDFETTDSVGVIRTLYKGVVNVAPDVSYD